MNRDGLRLLAVPVNTKVARVCLPLALVGCGAQEAPSGPPNLILVVGDAHALQGRLRP